MVKNKSDITIVCAGGGTGGHIYPGLAVADAVRTVCAENNRTVHIYWIGNSSGMDKTIVEKNIGADGKPSADRFYGIPSGKLRRYFSLKNFFDLFKIFEGFIASFFILLKIKPDVLFSKGGFVSVPPCFSARLLRIPVYTHECDFTPGLATRINAKSAKHILVSYSETSGFLGAAAARNCIVTGNPVRPVFYSASAEKGRSFLGIEAADKPVLLVLGGSLGARQINALVKENIEWLCSRFIVVHQTGAKNASDFVADDASECVRKNYRPYPFIYSEMPDVIAFCDVVLSRAGANSIWECAVLGKPMVLVPLCGSGTRGDQEDNAAYFEKAGAAVVLARENASSEKMRTALESFLDADTRRQFGEKARSLSGTEKPAEKIAGLLYTEVNKTFVGV